MRTPNLVLTRLLPCLALVLVLASLWVPLHVWVGGVGEPTTLTKSPPLLVSMAPMVLCVAWSWMGTPTRLWGGCTLLSSVVVGGALTYELTVRERIQWDGWDSATGQATGGEAWTVVSWGWWLSAAGCVLLAVAGLTGMLASRSAGASSPPAR